MATRNRKRSAPTKRRERARRDLYQDVTDKIIAQLEQGAVPWVQPWGREHIATPMGLPKNAATGNTYSGINILLLWGAAIETRRSTQVWVTFKQALSLTGTYIRRIDRPSGPYGVIEKSKEFSLVPWREVMDRNLGKQIGGMIRGRNISWTLGKNRSIGGS